LGHQSAMIQGHQHNEVIS